jgi:hypothetical protein
MVVLNLTNSEQKALISDSLILLSAYKWRLKADGRGMFYVAMSKRIAGRKNPVTIYLHKLVYAMAIGPIPKRHDVHHKNFNPLDCQNENLEPKTRGTHSQYWRRTKKEAMKVAEQELN